MLSNKPYMVRAIYEWIVDSSCTPYLLVNALYPNTHVPKDYIEEGRIVLNVAPEAIREFKIGNKLVEFRASFHGVIHIISVPLPAVLAIYAKENGEGLFFDDEDAEGSVDNTTAIEEAATTVAEAEAASTVTAAISNISRQQQAKDKSHLVVIK